MIPKDSDLNIGMEGNPETEGDPKHASFLFSLWRKVTAGSKTQQDDEKGDTNDSADESEPPAPTEQLTFEKSPAPEFLMRLYDLWQKEQNQENNRMLLVEDFCGESRPDLDLLKKFVSQIEMQARFYVKKQERLVKQNREMIEKYLAQLEKAKEEARVKAEQGAGTGAEAAPFDEAAIPTADITALEAPPPMAGEAVVLTAPNWSEAWCMVFPALGGGEPISLEAIQKVLEARGITYGLIKDEIERLASAEGCFTLLPVARGVAPVPGVDGKVIDRFPRTIGSPHFIENAQGIVDFNNLNWLVPIEKDTVICEILPPVKGKEGIDIRNHSVKAYEGKNANLPMGQNVVLNAEGTALQAKVSGQISFKGNKFQVTNTIIIPGNVDLSTGNLNVRGDLVIRGNVLAGFTVQASGDITIGGIVEGAQVSAGGSIIVNRGMNGNMVGNLVARKDIHCKYMENASVQADGDIYMDSIVNSEVFCNGRIITKTGRGVIIGGKVIAMGGIEAKIIGNKTGRVTVLSIEATPQFLQKKETLEKELEHLEHDLRKGEIAQSMGESVLDMKILQMKQNKQKQRLAELEDQEALIIRGQIVVDRLYPIVQVSLNGAALTVLKQYDDCRIYFDAADNDVKIMS